MNIDETPPEGRLTDETRAWIRAELMAAAREPVRRPRTWLAPVAAAAAVGVLVATATVVGVTLSDEEGGRPAPAEQDSTSVTPSPTPSTSSSPTPTHTRSAQPADPAACDREVREAAGYDTIPRGLERVAHLSYDEGTTWLYSNGGTALVCDDWPTHHGGSATLTSPRSFPPTLTKADLLISQNFGPGGEAQYFAAGARIPGVTSILYSFPDGDEADGGHIVAAALTDDMWVMQYLPPNAPQRAWTDPVKVAVSFEDGSQQSVYLSELDLCAQINHGC